MFGEHGEILDRPRATVKLATLLMYIHCARLGNFRPPDLRPLGLKAGIIEIACGVN